MDRKWKARFMNAAELVSSWSKFDQKDGCVLVNEDKSFRSLGFNGFTRGLKDTSQRINDENFRAEFGISAEENSIFFSKDKEMSGVTAFCYPNAPSIRVLSRMLHHGIRNIVALNPSPDQDSEIYHQLIAETDTEVTLLPRYQSYEQSMDGFKFTQEEQIDKWDKRYLKLAQLVSTWSKDPSTKVGAVIVRRNRSISSVGFNGFASGVSDSFDRLQNRSKKYPLTIHAEENAIRFAKDTDLSDTRIYVWPCQPCGPCLSRINQNDIPEVVTATDPSSDMENRWKDSFEGSVRVSKEVDVNITKHTITYEETRLDKGREINHSHDACCAPSL